MSEKAITVENKRKVMDILVSFINPISVANIAKKTKFSPQYTERVVAALFAEEKIQRTYAGKFALYFIAKYN